MEPANVSRINLAPKYLEPKCQVKQVDKRENVGAAQRVPNQPGTGVPGTKVPG
jgi:hypothetical protein